VSDKPKPTCETCRWPRWNGRHYYYGAAGHCLNPLNDHIDEETEFRTAMRIRNEDAACPEHTPQVEGQVEGGAR